MSTEKLSKRLNDAVESAGRSGSMDVSVGVISQWADEVRTMEAQIKEALSNAVAGIYFNPGPYVAGGEKPPTYLWGVVDALSAEAGALLRLSAEAAYKAYCSQGEASPKA